MEIERHPSNNKKYKEVVVLIHHYGGSQLTLRRHCEFLNELGFDVVTFNLSVRRITDLRRVPLSKDNRLGIRYIWHQDILKVLSQVKESKIIYSFSFPSVSALTALAEHGCEEVSAWVCDGGPFLQVRKNVWNYFSHITVIKNPILRGLVSGLNVLVWGYGNYKKDIHESLEKLPKGFPILSIRSWKDRLVSPQSIDEVFKPHQHLGLQVLTLPESRHLQGLKENPQDYMPRVTEFLKEYSHSI